MRVASWVKRLAAAPALFILAVGAGPVYGAGFAIYEQSTTGLGTAFAGAAAVAEDASTIFYNPAGMTRLPNNNAVATISPIFPQADYTDGGSVTFNPFFPMGPPAFPTSGATTDDGGTPVVSGGAYFSHQMSNDVWFGIGINSPYGLSTEYDPGWVGRYHAVKSQLLTFNINPAMAFKVSESLSLGVGVNFQFAYAELTNAIDGGLGFPPAVGGPFPGQFDSYIDINGVSLGFGVNAGFIWEPFDGTRLGVHYRSPVTHNLSGDADLIVNPATPFLPSKANAHAEITLPDTLAISVFQSLSPEVDVVADATWTDWSYLDALVVKLGGPPLGTSTTVLNWENTWRISGGVIYRPDDRWTLRAGYAYDETPIPSAALRTARIPDNTRHWATIGASYVIDEHVEASAAYAHLFVEKTTIQNVDPTGAHLLAGSYDSSVDIFSLQLTTSFESVDEIFE
jgi:long-chain fatty acid transport protein